MVQTMKEYQKEYFEKEGYTIIDNMENAISAFCERYPQPVSYTHLTLPTNSRV